jgi:uncharacterized SAM-binding protein YcdF (DUF218 family)
VPEEKAVDQTTARELTRYLDAGCPCPKADMAFVYGTRLPDPISLVSAMFHQQRITWITLSGGANRHTGAIEAEAHYQMLVRQGVPPDQMIVENRSTTTLENVTLAIPLICNRLDIERISSVVVVCKWHHSRRALMTLKRFWPRPVALYAQTYEMAIAQTDEPVPVARDTWWRHPASTAKVLAEAHKIPRYLAQGDLAEITFENGAWR